MEHKAEDAVQQGLLLPKEARHLAGDDVQAVHVGATGVQALPDVHVPQQFTGEPVGLQEAEELLVDAILLPELRKGTKSRLDLKHFSQQDTLCSLPRRSQFEIFPPLKKKKTKA